MKEIWKKINGYDGDYQVSNLGRVKSFKGCRGIKEIILQQLKNSDGYLYVELSKNGKPKSKKIHVLMFEVFNYKLKKGEVVHHKDRNKINNSFDNFKMMTNGDHIRLHNTGENNPNYGKDFSGENGPNSKLKKDDVIEIRVDLNEGILTQREIGLKFGVHQITISQIKTGKTWKHIK